MRKYLIKRIILSVVTLFVILLVLFLLLSFMPGSPFNPEKLSPDQIAVLNEKYGLDKPLPERFIIYVGKMLRGDLGISYSMSANTEVSTLLHNRLPITILIGVSSLVIGSIIGITVGMFAAMWRSKIMKAIYNLLTITGIAVPSYLIAMFLSYYAGYKQAWLPLLFDIDHPVFTSIIPVVSMSAIVVAVVSRFSCEEAERVVSSDYVMLARCQGVSTFNLITKYILPNSIMPVITIIAMLLVSLMTGSLVIEQMFSIPGTGALLTQAISSNDYNVILALSFVYSGMYIIAVLFVDVLYCIVDPRVRLAED